MANIPYICIYMKWNITHKNMKSEPFATAWMDLEGITLSEISQREK